MPLGDAAGGEGAGAGRAGPWAWERLAALGAHLNKALAEPDDMSEEVLSRARALFECDAGTLWLRRGSSLVREVVQNRQADARGLLGRSVGLDGSTTAGYVAITNQVLRVESVEALGGQYDASWDAQVGFQAGSYLGIPLTNRDGFVFGVVELLNPRQDGVLRVFGAEESAVARAMASQASLALQFASDREAREAEAFETVCGLAALAEWRDPEIPSHVRRIGGYCGVLAEAVGCEREEAQRIRLASPLHDVGKVGIPEEVLYKPGKLTEDEFRMSQEHCRLGQSLLAGVGAGSELLGLGGEIALTHHERWDGTGYPRKLSGESIPLAGRIVAIADVFDALTTRRSYKPAMGLEESVKILTQESGGHFDPAVVDAFQARFSDLLDVKREYGSG